MLATLALLVPPLGNVLSPLQVTFSMADSLFRSGTNHGHDEPAHLRLRNPGVPVVVNQPVYAGPESRYCPAGASQGPTVPQGLRSRAMRTEHASL